MAIPELGSPHVTSGRNQIGDSLGRTIASGIAASAKKSSHTIGERTSAAATAAARLRGAT